MTLAYTSSGVESVTLIDQEKLDHLARWLCQENEYHYVVEKSRCCAATDQAFESQQQQNGGYCHICKDFAGELLSHFDLSTKVSA